MRLELPATLEAVDRAVEAAMRFFAGHAGAAGLFPVATALREALLNAVVHGCGRSPERMVTCRLRVEGGQAVMEVSDPGPGFDWRGKSALPPSPETISGRGMSIMSLYAGTVEYNDAGNTLTLRVGLA